MLERGLLPEFSRQALADLDRIREPATRAEEPTRDLRNLIWCSIDNDDSRDLDQLTVAEAMRGEAAKILVAIADVDAVVKKQSALDDRARHNATLVYTAAEIFPMLPEKLSTDLTSINYGSDRLAIVIEMVIAEDGSLQGSDIHRAMVHGRAKLAYNSVAGWLEGNGPMPTIPEALKKWGENMQHSSPHWPEHQRLSLSVQADSDLPWFCFLGLRNIHLEDSISISGFDPVMLYGLGDKERAGKFSCKSLYPMVFIPIRRLFELPLPAQGKSPILKLQVKVFFLHTRKLSADQIGVLALKDVHRRIPDPGRSRIEKPRPTIGVLQKIVNVARTLKGLPSH